MKENTEARIKMHPM